MPGPVQTSLVVIRYVYLQGAIYRHIYIYIYLYHSLQTDFRIPRGTDKSPLGQKPTRTIAHWTIAHWTKAHCLIWHGGQKPTSLKKKRFKSFIKLLTLIRLLLQRKSHLQCVFTNIIISPVCRDKQLNLGVKSH